MNFNSALTAILLFIFSTAVSATPTAEHASRSALDDFVPPIISPNETTIWTTGTIQSVTWNATNAPAVIENRGVIILLYGGILADGFDLRAGSVNVTVPPVPPGSYQIVLFGNSRNISPFFQIVDP